MLNGYTIPRGTWVLPMLYSIHMDESVWKDPAEFRPGRFMNDEGKCQRPDMLVPFGIGKFIIAGNSLKTLHVNGVSLTECMDSWFIAIF